MSSESGDRYAEALEESDRGLEMARRNGDRANEANFLAGPLSALILLGRWDEALARAAEVERLPGAESTRQLLLHLAEIDCWQGRISDARARIDAHADARSSDDVQVRQWIRHARGDGAPDGGQAESCAGGCGARHRGP